MTLDEIHREAGQVWEIDALKVVRLGFVAVNGFAEREDGYTYYYDDPVRHRNGEFDVALSFGDEYEIYEAKYYRNPMTLDEIHREAGQVREIDALNVVRLGFITANGFAKQEDGYTYYNGEDLYQVSAILKKY
jgi:hypothetical protein